MRSSLLKAERKQQGWSEAQVAAALGVSVRTVIRWEQGVVIPHPYYLHQLCNLFGKTPEELELRSDIIESNLPESVMQMSLFVDPSIPESLGYADRLLGRGSLFIQVKQHLFVGESVALTVLSGLLGIGCTALTVALAADHEIRAHFDGILWAGLGPHPNVLGQLTRWGKLLGIIPSQVKNINSREAWGKAIRAAIGTRKMLLVIEDAVTIQDALAFHVGGTECAYLLTSCSSRIAFAFTQNEPITIPELEKADGLALLARFVPHLVEQDLQGACALVEAVGCLPLALTLMGKYLASQAFTDQSWSLRTILSQLHDTEQSLRVSLPNLLKNGSGSLANVQLSLYASIAICDQRLSPRAHAALCALAIFPPKPQSFSQAMALAVGQQPQEALDELCSVGLLENWGPGRYTLHQAIAHYAHIQRN